MVHQSLYRRYRPQTFADVVGQDHITRTLRNEIAAGSVAHAYLFAGPRGTGKTTTARILAKAVDCEQGPTPQPDNTCASCVEIMEGRHPDVYELDAASRTGVDNVREEIISRVAYAPVRGPMKFYIIDEVHMLSTSAFNALLKTIEEPPPHAVFILCTTHPQKVPETIQSRCQRFDFRRIGVEDIAGRLGFIAQQESVRAEPSALTLIARHAAGGMRDAISTFEQLAAYTGDAIALADVEGLLGGVDSALLFELADDAARRDIGGCFTFVARIMEAGVDAREFVDGLTGHFRDLFVSSSVDQTDGIVDTTAEERVRLASQAALFGPERLARCLDLLGELASQVRWAADPRLALEVTLVRMCAPRGELTLAALAERLDALEDASSSEGPARPAAVPAAPADRAERPAGGGTVPKRNFAGKDQAPDSADASTARADGAAQPTASATAPHAGSAAPPTVGDEECDAYAPPTRAAAGSLDRARLVREWPDVIEAVRATSAPIAHMLAGTVPDVDGDDLVVEFPADESIQEELVGEHDNMRLLREAIANVFGAVFPVRTQLGRGSIKPTVEPAGEMPAVPESEEPADGLEGKPASSVAQAARRGRPGTADIDAMLRDELGAQLVSEHPADEKDR